MARPERLWKPAVVFVDDAPWESFFRLAAALRKVGLRTVRVAIGAQEWQPSRLLFDRTVSLPSLPGPEVLAEILSDEYVTDVQLTEQVALTTYAALDLLPASQRSDLWAGRTTALDKFCVAQSLRAAGLRTPDVLAAAGSSPTDIAATLALPVVVKRRVGAAGGDIGVISSVDELEDRIAAMEHPDEWFFERFVAGRSMGCGVCVGDSGIDVLAAFEVLDRRHHFGPSSEVAFHPDPELARAATVLIATLALRGIVGFDVIRDAEGIDWIHDVNPRVFETFTMGQMAGYDFLGAYVRCLTGAAPADEVPPAPTAPIFAFPGGWRKVVRAGRRRHAFPRTLWWVWHHERILGFRYFLFLGRRRVHAVRRVQMRRGSVPAHR